MEVKNETITLCDLIRGFMEFAVEKGKLNFPPLHTASTRPWHEFLYTLKKNHISRFPELECVGKFICDGSHTTACNLNDIAVYIFFTNICWIRAHDYRVYFYLDIKRTVNPLAATHPELLETMYQVARETENFFED